MRSRESFDLVQAFSSLRRVALILERNGVNQGFDGREETGLLMSGACLSRRRVSVLL